MMSNGIGDVGHGQRGSRPPVLDLGKVLKGLDEKEVTMGPSGKWGRVVGGG